ncbi:MAG TPA: hypothetical protein VK137_09175, partial [Planctomycetaceae bacterium]|nr:hypothetical protein [Planctomycetaceae bacterium]
AMALFTPLIFAGVLVYGLASGAAAHNSTKGLVARCLELRPSAEIGLVFMTPSPYSVQFYLAGRAEEVANMNQLATRLNEKRAFFALRPQVYDSLREPLRHKLERVAEDGEFRLYRSK